MASSSTISMALPLTYATQKKQPIVADNFFKPLQVRPSKTLAAPKPIAKFQVNASLNEKAVTGLMAAALTASMMMPEVAEAADSSVSPSLKNFLLSILAGGVVLGAILGAIVAVSNFDPVKRT